MTKDRLNLNDVNELLNHVEPLDDYSINAICHAPLDTLSDYMRAILSMRDVSDLLYIKAEAAEKLTGAARDTIRDLAQLVYRTEVEREKNN